MAPLRIERIEQEHGALTLNPYLYRRTGCFLKRQTQGGSFRSGRPLRIKRSAYRAEFFSRAPTNSER